MQSVLVLDVLRFGAKRVAFWCKTCCVLVLNAAHFGAKRKVNAAKCEMISINIHTEEVAKTFAKHQKHDS